MGEALEVGQLRFEVRSPRSPSLLVETRASLALAKALSESDPEFTMAFSTLVSGTDRRFSLALPGGGDPVTVERGAEFEDSCVLLVWEGRREPVGDVATLERKIASLESDLGHLTKLVAHDLRGPIRSARGFAALALSEPDAEKARAHLRTLESSLVRLEGLVEGLLLVAELSRREPTFVSLDVEEISRTLASERGLENGGLEVVNEARVLADRDLVALALGALFDNAVRFALPGEKAQIAVVVSSEGATTTITVSDRGIGVATEKKEELFELLKTAHPKRLAGAGVGLSLVRRVMDLHDGEAKLESTLGAGTSVTLVFPAQR